MRKFFIFSLASFAFTGCWVNDLFIRNIDNIIEIKASDTLGLYYGQKEKLEKDVSKFLTSAKERAPKIRAKLREYKSWFKKEPPGEKAIHLEMRFWQELTQNLASEAAAKHIDYLAGLSEKQQEEFFKEVEDKNEEIAQKNKENDLEDLAKGYEFFFGDLNKKQKQILKQHRDFFKKRGEERLSKRLAFQKKLKGLFAKKAPEDEFKRLALNSIQSRYDHQANQRRASIIASLIKAADAEQLQTLNENLNKLENWVAVFVSTEY